MALRLVQARSNPQLWAACAQRFLLELEGRVGPGDHPVWLWLTHRLQGEALFRAAAERGLTGWLQPPVSFLSDLPRAFEVRERPIGLFARRALIGGIARERGDRLGMAGAAASDRRGIATALDGLFGELLPEGVPPEALGDALAGLTGDEFAGRRDRWIVETYAAYLAELRDRRRYDPRAIHAIAAERIRAGGLPHALRGARRLHIYGLTSTRTRRRLLEALRDQGDVEVSLYLAHEEEEGEWDELGAARESLEGDGPPPPDVQPVPDERRELEWVACRVKELLAAGVARPHEVAIVARTGREDARAAHEVLNAAGIPNTARIRSPLAEIPALKAVLALFRGAARGWRYRPLRHVLESSYFRLDIDLRSVDHIAQQRRVEGLDAWGRELRRLRDLVAAARDDWQFRRGGLFAERLARDCDRFDEFRRQVEPLGAARPLAEWVALTRQLLRPGWFDFSSRLCNDDGERWEIVRLDQRGVERLHRTLAEWPEGAAVPVAGDGHGASGDGGAGHGDAGDRGVVGDVISPADWYARLRRFLESNELALTTPTQTGVQVLEAHEAALLPLGHIFVIHANDGDFPRRPPTPAIFSDEERRELAGRGLPLTHRELWLRRERALWHAVTCNRNVTITYRTADPRGVPLLPSLMVPEHDASKEIPRTQYTWPVAFNTAQERRRGTKRFAELKRDQEPGAIRVPEPGALRHAVLAAFAESRRREDVAGDRTSGTLGPWNGELRDPWVLAYLADRFGPDRVWSASQLESYAACPFVYFVQRVLWLDELAEAEEEVTPLTFGSVAHAILERFYPALLDGPFPSELDQASRVTYERVAEEVLTEAETGVDDWLGLPALWAVTRRDLVQKVRDYLTWELPAFADWRPHDFEHRFGENEDDVVVLEGNDVDGERRTLRLRGRIDRVDVRAVGAGVEYRIIDYKKKRVPAKTHYGHGVVQIPIYMKALAQRLGAHVASGAYRSIEESKEGGHARWGDQNFQRALEIAMSIPPWVRAGRFEPQAAKPSGWPNYWPGLNVCRVRHIYKEGSRFDAR